MREEIRQEQIEAWKKFLREHPEDITSFLHAMDLLTASQWSTYLMDRFVLYVDSEPFVTSLDLREGLDAVRSELNIPSHDGIATE